jgi:histidinol dehydrogenase
MARLMHASAPGFAADYERLIAARGERLDEAEAAAREIVATVRARGMDAVCAFAEKFDGVRLAADQVRVRDEESIRAFHEQERPQDGSFVDAAGVRLGWRWSAVDSAGIYAPNGQTALPSSVLMNAIPAKAAGVARIVMATPPGNLDAHPALLAAAKIAGVDEVWRMGGAQAIAALAYGAAPLERTDVVVGPGAAYTAAAKRVIYGAVGVDSVAGPSEVFVLCDGGADPRWIAADLLAQAEHDADAQSVLFTTGERFADAAAREVDLMLETGGLHPRARSSWARHGAIVIVRALEEALPLLNRAAPEHVQIVAANAEALAAGVRHAGAIFVGAHAPEALGDYIAGPSHVLPTVRGARFASGVTTQTFMKRTSLIGADAAALRALGPAAAAIADAEQLPAHARSIRIRLEPDR